MFVTDVYHCCLSLLCTLAPIRLHTTISHYLQRYHHFAHNTLSLPPTSTPLPACRGGKRHYLDFGSNTGHHQRQCPCSCSGGEIDRGWVVDIQSSRTYRGKCCNDTGTRGKAWSCQAHCPCVVRYSPIPITLLLPLLPLPLPLLL